ncbi:cell wall-binding repeat-containing protein [Pseudalkalibacillus hwajinpoensis]|uniref:cell wall-binding repeat-containing protein n=1 Tax=Guptibacillus hwajinpoensis TaxID=208199 RepID=UPI00325ABBE3
MMKKRAYGIGVLLCSLMVMVVFVSEANAMPARGEAKEIIQPTGESFNAKLNGSETLNWWTTEDHAVIQMGPDQYWYYTRINGQELELTTHKYEIDEKPADAATSVEVEKLHTTIDKKTNQKDIPNPDDQIDLLSTTGDDATLVLLVEYNDMKIKYSEAEWSNRFFGTNGSTLNSYYDEVSQGKLGFKGAQETSGTVNDGIIKVFLNKDHPRPEATYNPFGAYAQILTDALTASNAKVDYAQFDKNKDGFLSSEELHIVTIVAGGEASYNDTGRVVWGHMSSLYDVAAPRLDGVKVGAHKAGGSYTMFGEKHGGHMATVGIIAHEMGHDLGLPDLYDTDGSSEGVGIHSLMGSGSWTKYNSQFDGEYPTHMDAWSKMVLGFIRPIDVTDNGTYEVVNFKSDDYSVLKLNTTDESEYFLIENRQYNGFDVGLSDFVKKPGIAIWHIDEDQLENGKNNDDESHKAVDLEESNESVIGFPKLDFNSQEQYHFYDHYFNANGNARFNSSTSPTSRVYAGLSSGVAVTVLDPSQEAMTVSVKVPGGEDQQPPVWPTGSKLAASSIKEDTVTLNWSQATDDSGVKSYFIFKNGSFLKEVDGTSRTLKVQGLASNKEYLFKVEAVDQKGYATKNGPTLNVKTSGKTTERIEGLNRFETAATISGKTYTEAETVVIARGLDFPDALAGAPLAYQLKGPILLAKTNELPEETAKEIRDLGAKKAIILGGVNAISTSTEEAIKSLGITTERISGKDRYETAAKVAKRMGGSPDQAVIAYGLKFPDALAIAPYAAQNGYPILLVDKSKVPEATGQTLEGIDNTIVIGGDQVISKTVYDNLPSPERISGQNRFGTAAAVKAAFYPDAKRVYLATGFGFADALAGSILAAKEGAPLLLVKRDELPAETSGAISGVTEFKLLGGQSAISNNVQDALYR